jgi:uncharacterized protein
MLSVILDTNLFISAYISGGMTETILDLIVDGKLKLNVSQHLINEVLDKLVNKFGFDESDLEKFNDLINLRSMPYLTFQNVKICRDPKDDFLIDLIIASNPDYLITRDKDLLEIEQSFGKTRIIKPEEFMGILRSTKILE